MQEVIPFKAFGKIAVGFPMRNFQQNWFHHKPRRVFPLFQHYCKEPNVNKVPHRFNRLLRNTCTPDSDFPSRPSVVFDSQPLRNCDSTEFVFQTTIAAVVVVFVVVCLFPVWWWLKWLRCSKFRRCFARGERCIHFTPSQPVVESVRQHLWVIVP